MVSRRLLHALVALTSLVSFACSSSSTEPGADEVEEGALGAGDRVVARTEGEDFPGWISVDGDTLYAHLFQDGGRDAAGDRPDKSKVVAYSLDGTGGAKVLWEGEGAVVWRIAVDADHVYFTARRERSGEGLVYRVAKAGGEATLLETTPPRRFGPGNVHFRATEEYLVVRNSDEPCAIMKKNMTDVVRTIRADEFLTHDETHAYVATERDGKYGIYAEPLGGGPARLVTAELERPRTSLDSATKPGFSFSDERLVTTGGAYLYALVVDEPGEAPYIAKIHAQTGAIERAPYVPPTRGERERYIMASDTHVCTLSARDVLRCQHASGGAPRRIADPVYQPGVLRGDEIVHSARDDRRDGGWMYLTTRI